MNKLACPKLANRIFTRIGLKLVTRAVGNENTTGNRRLTGRRADKPIRDKDFPLMKISLVIIAYE